MKTRSIIVSVVLLLVMISGIILYQYNKPARNVASEKSVSVTAEQLFQQFSTNEVAANKLYLNQVLEVSGYIAEIKHTEQGKDVIILKSGDPMFGISCSLEDNTTEPIKLKSGDSATLKGICTGYLTDVVLIRSNLLK